MYMFHIFIVQGADRCWSRALSADAIVENGQFTPGIAVVGYKDTCSISIKKLASATLEHGLIALLDRAVSHG